MNLVGKIFIVTILVMSIVFMSLSLMVYATHRNWRDLVKNATPTGALPLGLEIQLQQQRDRNAELELEKERLTTTLEMERAARQQALSVLEARASRLQDELNKQTEAVSTLRRQHDDAVTAMELAQKNLARVTAETRDLRVQIRRAQQDRDDQFAQVVKLLDESNQLHGLQRQLEERNNSLTARVGKMNRVLERFDLSESTPLHNIPPKLDGYVTQVRDTNLVEVSLGSDDGLRVGHTLDIYRPGGVYLGRVEVTYTDPDRSVAKILKDFRQGIVRKGDRVATRLLDGARSARLETQ